MKDKELDSSPAALHEKKEAYLCLEYEFADMTHNYDKLLAKFDAYHEAVVSLLKNPSVKSSLMHTSWAT